MVLRKCVAVLFVLLFVSFTVSSAEKDKEIHVPDWLRSGEPVRSDQVAAEDYPYLIQWLDDDSQPADEYMVRLFDTYQIVILAEEHNVKEHKDFVIELIPKLYHEAGVRCIGWEFSPFTKNKRLEELITAPNYDEDAVLQFARECSCSPDWNSKEHWEIIKAVWSLNKSLKSELEKMRLIGLLGDIDFTGMTIDAHTKPIASPEFQASSEFQDLVKQYIKYDTSMAQYVEKEILQKGHRGLVFVGLGHDWTEYRYPARVNFGIDIRTMGNLLKEKYGDQVFNVRTQCSADPSFIDEVMKSRDYERVGFNVQDSPFANILVPVYRGAPDVPWSKLACGSVYLGPRASLHSNTTIKGYVTKRMFEKYKEYYNVCFGNGRNFNNAEEVDKYLQQNRWPKPR
jgi:hypothetical protein